MLQGRGALLLFSKTESIHGLIILSTQLTQLYLYEVIVKSYQKTIGKASYVLGMCHLMKGNAAECSGKSYNKL